MFQLLAFDFCEYRKGKLFKVAFDSIDISVNELPAFERFTVLVTVSKGRCRFLASLLGAA